VCTVLLRFDPSARWPVVLGAVRDEFVERSWDPPAAHWVDRGDGRWARFVGGRDHTAGGTWLAVDPSPDRPAVAAVLNGRPQDREKELDPGVVRPTRGELVLRVLAGDGVPAGAELAPYARFHLLLATARSCELWSWDLGELTHTVLRGPHHLIVNDGLDAGDDDPMVPHFAPLLAAAAEPDPGRAGAGAWGGWTELLQGDGLPGDDPRALLVTKEIEGHPYGSTSAALVAVSADGRVRYDFTPRPSDPARWQTVVAT
jgi:hypothetical protein